MTIPLRAATFGSLLFVLLPLAAPANAQAVERFTALARRLPANTTTFGLVDHLGTPVRALTEWEPMKLLLDRAVRDSGNLTPERIRSALDAFPKSVAYGCDDATIETLGRFVAMFGGLAIAETGRLRRESDWVDAAMTTLDEALARPLTMSIVAEAELADAAHGPMLALEIRNAVAMAVPFGVVVTEHDNGQDLAIPVEAILERVMPTLLRAYRRPMTAGAELDERQQRVAAAMKALRYELRWRIDGSRFLVELGKRGAGELDPAPALGELWPPSDETRTIGVIDSRLYYDQFVDFDDWLHDDQERYGALVDHASALMEWFSDDFTVHECVNAVRLDVGSQIRYAWIEQAEDVELDDGHIAASNLHRAAPRGALVASTFGHMALDETMYLAAELVLEVAVDVLGSVPDGAASSWLTAVLDVWSELSEPFDEWIGGEDSAVFEAGSVLVVDLVGTESAPMPAFGFVGKLTDPATAKTFATEFHERFASVVGLAPPGSTLEDAVVAGLKGWRPTDAPTDAEGPLLHHVVLDDLYIASTAPALTARIVHAWRESKDLPAVPETRCQEHRFHGDQLARLAAFVDAIPDLGDDGRTLFRSLLQSLGRSIESIVATVDHVGSGIRADVVIRPRGK